MDTGGARVLVSGGTARSTQDGNQFVMPDLSGKYWVDAQPQQEALGWHGVMNYDGDAPGDAANHHRIVFQDPPAGTTHDKDADITLRFGQ